MKPQPVFIYRQHLAAARGKTSTTELLDNVLYISKKAVKKKTIKVNKIRNNINSLGVYALSIVKFA